MIRRAFVMRLKPDALAEYRRQHEQVWPELVAEIERSGIASISTFQHGLELFLFSEITDEAAWRRLWSSEVYKRWARVLEPLMHLDQAGDAETVELTEIFRVTTGADRRPVAETVIAIDELDEVESLNGPITRAGASSGGWAPAPIARSAVEMGVESIGISSAGASAPDDELTEDNWVLSMQSAPPATEADSLVPPKHARKMSARPATKSATAIHATARPAATTARKARHKLARRSQRHAVGVTVKKPGKKKAPQKAAQKRAPSKKKSATPVKTTARKSKQKRSAKHR